MTDKPEREINHERAALRGDERAKACPFCGEMPEVEQGLTARIACIEVDCLNPIVHSPTLADALAFWNMRRGVRTGGKLERRARVEESDFLES
ncbi:hypothetical protein [Bradyrhizobium sp. LMG 9283]|uniref:hypothetical protein n=1 Tax=Bradyrhizobium sp. LMG 9283 TaxID=592064 RepID=UPI00388FB6B6